MGPKPNNATRPPGPARPMGPGVKEMRGPSGVDDILSMVNNKPASGPPKVEREESISSVSSQESGNKKRIKMRKPPQKNSNGKFVLDLH